MPRPTSLTSRIAILRSRISQLSQSPARFTRTRPLTSFIVALLLLLGLIAAGNFLFKPAIQETPKNTAPKTVEVYNIGTAPKLTLQAQVQKSGVVTILAQTPGIVQKLAVKEGDAVKRGVVLVSLSTNYQGGNAMSLSRAIAQKQNQLTKDTYQNQKDIITKVRDSINATSDNTQKLRQIAADSNQDTIDTINLDQNILDQLRKNRQDLENASSPDQQAILQAKQLESQYAGILIQLRSAQRSLDLQAGPDKPPTRLANLQKEITLKQLDIQEKTLDISKEINQLQLNLALVNEALMFPASPSLGTVQKVYVRVGQQVNPGTPLVQVSAPDGQISLTAKVPDYIARSVSGLEPTILMLDTGQVEVRPSFVSTEATDGGLYSISYDLANDYQDRLTDKSFVSLQVPVGQIDTGSAIPFVPLDSVFQTSDETYVFVIDGSNAASRKISLGNVLGRFVEVKDGLKSGDQVILNRNVITGDAVTSAK